MNGEKTILDHLDKGLLLNGGIQCDIMRYNLNVHIAGLVVNYSISNTIVLEIPQFTTKTTTYALDYICHK